MNSLFKPNLNSVDLGTFLGDNEAERFQMQLSAKTVSLWSHLNRPEVLRSFLNPLYEPNQRVIWPSVAPMSLVNCFYFILFYTFYFWTFFLLLIN